MNYSYKRYWEPSYFEALTLSLGAGTIASFISYPVEFVKTSIQVRAEGKGIRQKNFVGGYNANQIFREFHATGAGMRGFYHGFDAFLLGRLSYLFTRNTIYYILYDRYKPIKPTNDLTIREKAVISSIAGTVAAIVSNPFEVVNVRMIADKSIPSNFRRNYLSFNDGYSKLSVTDGKGASMRGVTPAILRAIALNSTLTGTYDYLKEKCWITFGDLPANRWFALLWASFWGTVVTLPLDNIKTRVQKYFVDKPELNRINYNGVLDVIKKTIEIEGPTGFYAGFYAYYFRVFLYAWATIQVSDRYLTSRKQGLGLKEWEI